MPILFVLPLVVLVWYELSCGGELFVVSKLIQLFRSLRREGNEPAMMPKPSSKTEQRKTLPLFSAAMMLDLKSMRKARKEGWRRRESLLHLRRIFTGGPMEDI